MRNIQYGFNRKWNKQPKELKEIFYNNLPLPIEWIGIIFFGIIFGGSILIRKIGIPQHYNQPLVLISLILFVGWLYVKIFFNYKKKTGRDFTRDAIKIQTGKNV